MTGRKLTRQERRRLERQGPKVQAPHTIIGGKIVAKRECQLSVLLDRPTQAPGSPTAKSIAAVVDTGATNSAINQSVVDALKLPVVSRARVNTAGGTHEVDVVAALISLPSHDTPGKVFSKLVQLSVVDMVGDMLFGMDLMVGGVLTVDLCAETWEWRLMVAAQQKT